MFKLLTFVYISYVLTRRNVRVVNIVYKFPSSPLTLENVARSSPFPIRVHSVGNLYQSERLGNTFRWKSGSLIPPTHVENVIEDTGNWSQGTKITSIF